MESKEKQVTILMGKVCFTKLFRTDVFVCNILYLAANEHSEKQRSLLRSQTLFPSIKLLDLTMHIPKEAFRQPSSRTE